MEKFVEAELPDGAPDILKLDKVYLNHTYQVNVRKVSEDGWLWLSIKRMDKKSIHDWREFQLIKNMIVGKEREAVELYPAESRLVDSSNQYHLFVLPEGERFPFGYTSRFLVDAQEGGFQKAGQRAWSEDEKPPDVISPANAKRRLERYGTDVQCDCDEMGRAQYGQYQDKNGKVRCNNCEGIVE